MISPDYTPISPHKSEIVLVGKVLLYINIRSLYILFYLPPLPSMEETESRSKDGTIVFSAYPNAKQKVRISPQRVQLVKLVELSNRSIKSEKSVALSSSGCFNVSEKA